MLVTNLADLLDILSKKYSWKNVTDSSTPLVWDVVGIGSLSSMAKFQLRLHKYGNTPMTTVSMPRHVDAGTQSSQTGYYAKAGSASWQFGNPFDTLTNFAVGLPPDESGQRLEMAYFRTATDTQLTFNVTKNSTSYVWKYAVDTNRAASYGNPKDPIANIYALFQSLYAQYSWSDGKKILMDWPQLLTENKDDNLYFKLRLGTVVASADGPKRRRTQQTPNPTQSIVTSVSNALQGLAFQDLFPSLKNVPTDAESQKAARDAVSTEIVEDRREDDPPTKPRIFAGGVTVWDILYELLAQHNIWVYVAKDVKDGTEAYILYIVYRRYY